MDINTTIFTFVNIVVYNILGFPLIYNLLKGRKLSFLRRFKLREFWLWSLVLFFCIYATYSGDWIHYKDIVAYIAINSDAVGELEPFYMNLIDDIGGNYFIFRLIVWGGAVLLLMLIFKHLEVISEDSIRLFSVWAIVLFAYPRVSLGLSLFFYGFVLIVKPYKKSRILSFLIGTMCIYYSMFFHKSIIILLCLFPVSFINIDKWKSYVLPLFFWLAVVLLNKYLHMFEAFEGFHYVHEDKYISSFGYSLVNYLLRMPIYIVVIGLMYKFSIKKLYKIVPNSIKRTYFIVLNIFILSLLFLFANVENNVIFYRILYMIFIPLVVVLIYCFKYNISNRLTKNTTLLVYLSSNLFLMYCLLGHMNSSIQ